jgi:hypothetical protein
MSKHARDENILSSAIPSTFSLFWPTYTPILVFVWPHEFAAATTHGVFRSKNLSKELIRSKRHSVRLSNSIPYAITLVKLMDDIDKDQLMDDA